MPHNPHPRDVEAGESATAHLLEKGHGKLVERERAVIYLEPPRRFRNEPPMEATPDLQAKLDLARSWIGKIETWPWIKSVVMVRLKTTNLTNPLMANAPESASKNGKASDAEKSNPDETRFFVSSLTLSPLQMTRHAVRHWAVETARWHLDMAFHEDDSKIGHGYAPENLSTLRKIARDFALAANQALQSERFQRHGQDMLQPRMPQGHHGQGARQSGKDGKLECIVRKRLL